VWEFWEIERLRDLRLRFRSGYRDEIDEGPEKAVRPVQDRLDREIAEYRMKTED
jgi:hypothetical protein